MFYRNCSGNFIQLIVKQRNYLKKIKMRIECNIKIKKMYVIW